MKFKFCNGAKRFWGFIFPWALLFIFMGSLGAGRSVNMDMDKDEIQVTGRIYVMGNEPFTQVGIESDNGKVFALTGRDEEELRRLQGKRLTVTGKLGGKTPRGVEAMEVKSFKIVEPK